ncbi:MAG: LOG family protein [Rhodospirillales bacterium]|nr:LOG family protein [Rhodospirillales bacterium]
MTMEDDRYQAIKAYRNEGFVDSSDGRALRILAEFMEPQTRLDKFKIQDTIVFMGSARILSQEKAEIAIEESQKTGKGKKKAKKDLKLSRYYEETRQLAFKMTEWSKSLQGDDRRFVVCTGGGPGIMEAANRGASEAKGVNVGFNISLPMEQHENPYITRHLTFEFHYFFMRKFWFAYLAKAIVVAPGGFGTLEELFELLTLIQTRVIRKHLPIVLYGTEYWDKVFDLEALADFGTIDRKDLKLFFRTDSVDEAFDYLTKELLEHSMPIPGARR